MANTLLKDRILIEYIPGTEADPGHPGSPGSPERTVWELQDKRYEAPASSMTRLSDGTWTTPLDILRQMVGLPGLTATAAHYSDVWVAVVQESTGLRTDRVPVTWTNAWITRKERVKVTYPAVPPTPPRAPTPGNPARSVYNLRLGWNAGARSARVLPSGWTGTARFTINKPVGAVVGFSPAATAPVRFRSGFKAITYGLVIGSGQIRVREKGVTGKSLAPTTGADEIEARITPSTIEWVINGSSVFRGLFRMDDDFILDAVLYSGGDAVNNPSLADGVVSDADAGNLLLAPLAIALGGDGQGARLSLKPLELLGGDAIAQGTLRMGAPHVSSAPLPRGALRVRPVRLLASDQVHDGFGVLRLVGPSAEAEVIGGDSAWAPEYSIGALGLLPVTLSAVAISGGVLGAELQTAAVRVLASEDAYGEARMTTAPLRALSDVEAITPLVRAQELMGAVHTAQTTMYVAITISETLSAGGVASVSAMTLTAQAMEQVGAEDEASLTEHIVAAAMEQLGVAEKHMALLFKIVNGQPVLLNDGEAWVVNTATNASTRYEMYGFNSFMAVGTRHFGVRKDGVYLLEGSTDAGQPIAAGVALGKHDFGNQNIKRIEAIYAGVSATGQLVLKVRDGQGEYAYRARRVDRDMQTQRFDPGRGLRANFFEFDLLNASGGEFELHNITFSLVASKRRI